MDQAAIGIGDSSRLNGLQVLIVDDCRAYRKAMTAMALLHGANITETDSAASGLLALNAALFDLVVTDIGLPDMSGSVVAAHALSSGAAVLAVSAEAGHDAAPAAHAFAAKPFTCVSDFAAAMVEAVIARDSERRQEEARFQPEAIAV